MGIVALSPFYELLFRQVFVLFFSQLTDPMSFSGFLAGAITGDNRGRTGKYQGVRYTAHAVTSATAPSERYCSPFMRSPVFQQYSVRSPGV